MERLARLGYVDDVQFARSWIADRIRVKSYGRQRIARELAARGVDREIVQAELEAACDDEAEEERARALLGRKIQPPRIPGAAEQRKLFAWLVRKGFSPTTARDVLRTYSEQSEAQEPSDMPSS